MELKEIMQNYFENLRKVETLEQAKLASLNKWKFILDNIDEIRKNPFEYGNFITADCGLCIFAKKSTSYCSGCPLGGDELNCRRFPALRQFQSGVPTNKEIEDFIGVIENIDIPKGPEWKDITKECNFVPFQVPGDEYYIIQIYDNGVYIGKMFSSMVNKDIHIAEFNKDDKLERDGLYFKILKKV